MTKQTNTFNLALCTSFSNSNYALLNNNYAISNEQTIANLQSQLKKVSFKYNALLKSGDDRCIILDNHLNIVDFNDAAVGLIKKVFNQQLIRGTYIGSYLTGELAEPIMENCMRALRGDSFTVERHVSLAGDEFNWWQAQYSPAYNDMQHIAGIVFNATEISSRKAHESKIALQEQKLREIALMQSHDIRGPLCTLMGLLDLLQHENLADSCGYLQYINDTVALLDSRVRDIVDRSSGVK